MLVPQTLRLLKLIVLLFGKGCVQTKYVVRESRVRSCNETFRPPKDRKESKAEKRYRKDSLLICRYASLGHPNQMGALIYTEAIKGKLQWLIEKTGWKRDINRPLTSQ